MTSATDPDRFGSRSRPVRRTLAGSVGRGSLAALLLLLASLAGGVVAGALDSTDGFLSPAPPALEAAVGTRSVADANLELVLEELFEPVMTGRYQVYTLTVTNLGPIAAEAVVLTDVVPAGTTLVVAEPTAACTEAAGLITCDLGNLPAGTSATVTVTVYVQLTDTPVSLENLATVISSTFDPDTDNNDVAESTEVMPFADTVLLENAGGAPGHEVAVPLEGSIDLLVKEFDPPSVLHQTEVFPDGWLLAGFEKADDGSGLQTRVAVMAVEPATGAAEVRVVEGEDGSLLATCVLPAGLLPVSMQVVRDDRIANLRSWVVVGAVPAGGGGGRVLVFNARRGWLIYDWDIHAQAWPMGVAGLHDEISGAAPRIGVTWINRTNGNKKVQVRSLSGRPTGAKALPSAMTPLGLASVVNLFQGGLRSELAVLGWNRLHDRVQVRTVSDLAGLINDKKFSPGAQPIAIEAPELGFAPLDDNLAVLYRNTAPRAALRLFDTLSSTDLFTAGEPAGSVPLGLGVLADPILVSVYWLDPATGERFVTVRFAFTGAVLGTVPIP